MPRPGGYEYALPRSPTFLQWLWQHIRLDHLNLMSHPALHLLKSMLAIALTLLIDQGTRNPDSVSSTFTAILCITPTITTEWRVAKDIFIASVFGTMWGLTCAVIANRGDVFVSSLVESGAAWWLMLWIPLAVAVTIYTMLVLGKRDASTLTAGAFTALYVQFIAFSWDFAPTGIRGSVLSTAIVRFLAVSTGIFASFVINGVSSIFLLSVLFEHQFDTIHWMLEHATEFLSEDPFDKRVQRIFETLQDYIDNLVAAIEELKVRNSLYVGDSVAQAKLERHYECCRVDQQLLVFQQTIAVLAKLPELSQEEKHACRTLFQSLVRRQHLFPEKERLGGVPQGCQLLTRASQVLISRVEGFSPLSTAFMSESTWFSDSRRHNTGLLTAEQDAVTSDAPLLSTNPRTGVDVNDSA